MAPDPLEAPSDRVDEAPTRTAAARLRGEPVAIAGVEDLWELAGPGCTRGDIATLSRLLREAGRMWFEHGEVLMDVRSPDEMRAWVVRARVANRRERSAIARELFESASDHERH